MFFIDKLGHAPYKASMSSEDLSPLEELQSLINAHPIRISYRPFSDEEYPTTIPILENTNIQSTINVPQNHLHDPIKFARTLCETHDASKFHLLIPGRWFDKAGTRHGRGRGWYDRLLAHLPPEIPRLGIASEAQVSCTLLRRKQWDEPMDWLIYKNKEIWHIHKTHARTHTALVKS
jgi:5-formyltetrahydrofolate cyclo-ligase